MDWGALQALTELAGLVVVVASVVYIAIQTKQTNDHATASSEIEWINAWNHILNSWVSDERTADIIRRGFHSFNKLKPLEQTVFHMRVNSLINQWLVAQKLSEKKLIGEDIANEATKVIISTLTTPGGFEFFERDWKLLPGGAEIMQLVKGRKGRNPTFTEVFPWWSDSGTN